jgi:hypothetical protein
MIHKVINEYAVGSKLIPYAGGGDYGRCRRCGYEGLDIVKAPEPEPKKPVGWTKIPEE